MRPKQNALAASWGILAVRRAATLAQTSSSSNNKRPTSAVRPSKGQLQAGGGRACSVGTCCARRRAGPRSSAKVSGVPGAVSACRAADSSPTCTRCCRRGKGCLDGLHKFGPLGVAAFPTCARGMQQIARPKLIWAPAVQKPNAGGQAGAGECVHALCAQVCLLAHLVQRLRRAVRVRPALAQEQQKQHLLRSG